MEILTLQTSSCISMKGLAKTKTLQDGTIIITEWKTLELVLVPSLPYGDD